MPAAAGPAQPPHAATAPADGTSAASRLPHPGGSGLSAADLAKARSFGLRGLHERAGTVGGWVDISSGAQGTTVMLSVPIRGPKGEMPHFPETVQDMHDPSVWGDL